MSTIIQKTSGSAASRTLFLLALAAMTLLTTPAAMAQADDDTKFSLSLGLFVTDRESDTRLDGTEGTSGTDVDLEADLGLDSSDSVFRLDAIYRFNQKHRLDLSVFDLSRESSNVIQKDIEWNGTLFPIDTTVDSNFDLAIYKLAYTWSFMQRDKGFLGLTAGLYVAKIGTSLTGQEIGEQESSDVTAPLPVIGLRGRYEFTEKLSFRASGEIFGFKYEDFDGSLYDLYAGLDYQLFKHVAIGLGINSVELDVGVDKQDFTGDLTWKYDGGLLFLKFDF